MSNSRNSVNEARFSLMIQGDQLPVDDIERGLGLKATRLIRKGEVLNRLPLIEATEDEWLYVVPLTAHHGTDTELNTLLALLMEKHDVMMQLKSAYQVSLRLYVQSDYAQMAYQLMPETLAKIVATGLPLDVSSLSWGEVKL